MSLRGEDDQTEEPAALAREPHRVRAAAHETRVVFQQADEAYAPYACPASGECCQLSVTQREPWLWSPEWDVLREGSRRTHGPRLPPARTDGACRFLDSAGKRCTVYAHRPFGCRTFFCARIQGPAAQPRDRVIELSRRLERIAQHLDPDEQGPRPLSAWINDCED